MTERERQSERDRERQRDSETERAQRDRETETWGERQRDRERQRETGIYCFSTRITRVNAMPNVWGKTLLFLRIETTMTTSKHKLQ